MTGPEHLPDSLLIRALDGELSSPEGIQVDEHLSRCKECRERRDALVDLSMDLEDMVSSVVVEDSGLGRKQLSDRLETLPVRPAAKPRAASLRAAGWGGLIAAGVLAALLLAPQWKRTYVSHHDAIRSQNSSEFEIDGESFVSLPYSNPDLPLTAPHIVQMQVPVSSLAEAGILFEPVSTESAALDRSVLADVLLGIDGQPVGVHVLAEQ